MRDFRIALACVAGLGLMGCASDGYQGSYDDGARAPVRMGALSPQTPTMPGTSRVDSIPGQKALQCVPYAREHSAIKIFGDANTWWDRASGKYERGQMPAIGTVLVLHNYSASNTGHVAVVKRMVSAREIRIDHANWLNDGSIYVNNPVMDVSPGNDWSQVRVYNIKTGGWGAKVYPVKGFIGSGSDTAPRAPALAAPQPVPREDEELLPDEDLLLAQTAKPVARAMIATAQGASRPQIASAALPELAPELGPPPGSPFALTAEDLAIP
jgi:hypothetical protein